LLWAWGHPRKRQVLISSSSSYHCTIEAHSDFSQNWKPGLGIFPSFFQTIMCINHRQSAYHSALINQLSCAGEHVEVKWSDTTGTRTWNPLTLGWNS
jgi:hypothetical protein